MAAIILVALGWAGSATAQGRDSTDAHEPTAQVAQGRERRTPGFELGLGVGATRVSCAAPCAAATHFSAGPLLVFGGLVHPNIFVGGQATGSSLDDDGDNELSLWAVMPVVKYYPSRLFYVGGAVGYGEVDGRIGGSELRHGIWAAEFRAGWTMPWNRAVTPYVSFFRALSPLRVDGTTARARAHSFQLGVAFSTPGSY